MTMTVFKDFKDRQEPCNEQAQNDQI